MSLPNKATGSLAYAGILEKEADRRMRRNGARHGLRFAGAAGSALEGLSPASRPSRRSSTDLPNSARLLNVKPVWQIASPRWKKAAFSRELAVMAAELGLERPADSALRLWALISARVEEAGRKRQKGNPSSLLSRIRVSKSGTWRRKSRLRAPQI
ncbi:hypothetical protein BQ8482_290034 [Mesorhizobium delmotii]|uniref:Uncharacterized protein n=1 Tax=Mesorhizobium delmotii TaxID=1631247 RepID=A0A2P9AMQ4_9HYPH|nr:hypothetical protein BQ8482_290034 [Mesorhizobium delmotii]